MAGCRYVSCIGAEGWRSWGRSPSHHARRGRMSDPERKFQTAFWDILTDVRAPAIDSSAPEGAPVEEARVAVVIEDEADIRSLLSDVLAQAGFVVHGAGTGEDGLELVLRHQPLVTTLDVNMPGMDGFETAKRIRAVQRDLHRDAHRAHRGDRRAAGAEAGADDYVAKPFRPRELRARIEAMLRRPRQHIAAADRRSGPPGVRAPTAAGRCGWLEHRGLRLQPRDAGRRRSTAPSSSSRAASSTSSADLLGVRPPRARKRDLAHDAARRAVHRGRVRQRQRRPRDRGARREPAAQARRVAGPARAGSRPSAASATASPQLIGAGMPLLGLSDQHRGVDVGRRAAGRVARDRRRAGADVVADRVAERDADSDDRDDRRPLPRSSRRRADARDRRTGRGR